MPEVRNRSGVPHRHYDYARKAYLVWAPCEVKDVPHAVAQQVCQAHPGKMELVLLTPEPEPAEAPVDVSEDSIQEPPDSRGEIVSPPADVPEDFTEKAVDRAQRGGPTVYQRVIGMANSEGPVLLSGQKLVTTAGTAEALVASTKRVKRVQIIALSTNTKPVYLGGADVSSTTNVGLAASGSISLEAEGWMDLKDIYVDADVDGEGVDFYGVRA